MSGDSKHRVSSSNAVDTELCVPSHLLGILFVKKKNGLVSEVKLVNFSYTDIHKNTVFIRILLYTKG